MSVRQARSAHPTLSADAEVVTESVQAFADAYNEIMTAIDTLGDNELATDSLLFSIEQGLRNTMNSPASGLLSRSGL